MLAWTTRCKSATRLSMATSQTTTTTTMLGKHSHDDIVDGEQNVDRSPKRQRTEEPTRQGPTLEDMPAEVLSRIVSLLEWTQALGFGLVSRTCRNAVQFGGGVSNIRVSMNNQENAEAMPSTLTFFQSLGLIGSNTNVLINVLVSRASVSIRSKAVQTIAVLSALKNCCRSVELKVTCHGSEDGSRFFRSLNEALHPGWTASFFMHAAVYNNSAMPGFGEFVKRMNCRAVSVDCFNLSMTAHAELFSHCTMLYLVKCQNFTSEHLSVMTRSCRAVFLHACTPNGATEPSISADNCAHLAHCATIGMTSMMVTDEALRSLTACTRLSLNECTGFTESQLFKLHQSGVIIDLDGQYWPREPKLQNTDARFSALFRAL